MIGLHTNDKVISIQSRKCSKIGDFELGRVQISEICCLFVVDQSTKKNFCNRNASKHFIEITLIIVYYNTLYPLPHQPSSYVVGS
jgi:hypothetical protein